MQVHNVLSENLLIVRVLLHLLGLGGIVRLLLEHLHHLGGLLKVGNLLLDLGLHLSGQLLEGHLLLLSICGIRSSLLLVQVLVEVHHVLHLRTTWLNRGLSNLTFLGYHLLLKHLAEEILDLWVLNKVLQELNLGIAQCLDIKLDGVVLLPSVLLLLFLH